MIGELVTSGGAVMYTAFQFYATLMGLVLLYDFGPEERAGGFILPGLRTAAVWTFLVEVFGILQNGGSLGMLLTPDR